MPPFFDTLDLGDPQSQAAMGYLSGLASAFAQGGMPSRAPIPFGSTLGMAASDAMQGAYKGAQNAQSYNKGNIDTANSAVGLDHELLVENMLRRALGKPELTANDLRGGNFLARSPLFGFSDVQASPTAPTAPAGISGTTNEPPPADGSPPSPASDNSGLSTSLAMRMLFGGKDRYQMQRNGWAYDTWTNSWTHLPELGTGVTGELGPDGQVHASVAAGEPEALETVGRAQATGKAALTPMTVYDNAGNEYIVPATALLNSKMANSGGGQSSPLSTSPNAPAQPSAGVGSPYAQRVAQLESGNRTDATNGNSSAAGPDQFINSTWLQQAKKYLPPQMLQGLSDQQILALRTDPKVGPQISAFITDKYAGDNYGQLTQAGIKNVGAGELYLAQHFGPAGAAAILKAPVNTPLAQILPPQVMQANPDLQGATVGDIYSHANTAMRGVTMQAPGPPAQRGLPAAAPPNTPVANSNLGIPTKLDDFLTQLGPGYQPPTRPNAPQGAFMGEPGKGLEEIQKADGDRLEQYSKEAAGGQKIYTNLQQLYEIMGRGLSTGNITAEATHLTGLARQLGMSNLIPKNFDPNDANAFNKLATDLVFAQLKQIGGRPMVSEIEGLRQANPNTALTPAANVEILNNILADQRWRDARSDLGRQYMARFGSLGDFDARFNEKYPETDAYNRISSAAQKAGWKIPGGPGSPSGANGKGFNPDVQKQISEANIEATAKKHNVSVDKVKADLRAAGYQVP